jgi:hypothetical protein
LSLLALLAFFLVLEVLVLEVLVRPRGRSVGITSGALAERRLLNGLSGLSFRGRVETNFDPLVFQGCEECVDAIGAPVGNMYVEEAGVNQAFNDSLLSRKGVLALGAANIVSCNSTACVTALCVRTAASRISHAYARSAPVAVVERIVAIAISSAAFAAAQQTP